MTVSLIDRIRSTIPSRWISGPRFSALLGGLADSLQIIDDLFQTVRQQSRIMTATGLWLDLIVLDFFGPRMHRRVGQSDAALRSRVQSEILRERVTRGGMVRAITDLTGHAPRIVEPWNPGDCGGMGVGGVGLGVGGCLGSISTPGEVFIDVQRPDGAGIPDHAGLASLSSTQSIGGLGSGAIALESVSNVTGAVTDADIYDTITRTKPAGSLCWVRIYS